jgi:4-amino-4-deoxy-L-arabinose transferase-like glycosyltransferase
VKRPLPDLLRPRALARCWWLPLLPLAWLSLIWRLGERPLQNWDEARLAVSAAEMLHNRQWLITHYQGQPDLWSTKPPLLVWLQALSLHTFGYSEWAVRLPTLLAALALVALVAAFARRWLGGPLAGLLAGLALLGSKGFVAHHVARSADYETLLLLFTTGQVLAGFAWLHTRRPRYLLLLGAAVGLAVLTKSVAGLFLLPGLAIEVTRRGQLGRLLRQPALWGALLLALGPPALWYYLREQAAPGYWQAVWQNELGGRLGAALEDHAAPWYWYLQGLASQKFLLWLPGLLAAAWALARRPGPRPARRLLTLVAWAGGGCLLVISAASTKLAWYDAPLYPLLALVLGGGLALLARLVARPATLAAPARPWRGALLLAVAVLPSLVALQRRLGRLHAERYAEAEAGYGRFLRDPAATPTARLTVVHRSFYPNTISYNAPLEFYALAYRHAHPADTLDVRYDADQLPPGRTVLVCGRAARRLVGERYRTRVLYAADSCLTLRVEGPR